MKARFASAPAHDLPLLLGSNLADTKFQLREFHLRSGPGWGYASARRMIKPILEHEEGHSLEWYIRQIELIRPPSGRQPNAQVVRGLWSKRDELSGAVHQAPRWSYPVRRDMEIPIASDAVLVRDERASLFWMQLRRKIMVPTLHQLGVLSRLFILQAERAGYSDVGLTIADMRELNGECRVVNLWTLDDLPLVSEAFVEAMLQEIATAYDELVAEGFDPKAERHCRDKKPSSGPDLFTP